MLVLFIILFETWFVKPGRIFLSNYLLIIEKVYTLITDSERELNNVHEILNITSQITYTNSKVDKKHIVMQPDPVL